MQYARVQNLTYETINTLTYDQLQALERASDIGNTKIHNTYTKLNTRPVRTLQGLSYGTLEYSVKEAKGNAKLNIASTNETHTLYSKLSERKYGELDGLYIHAMEKSARENSVHGSFKILKPTKNYKVNIELIKKYFIKLEV
jgi:hypothetical protein